MITFTLATILALVLILIWIDTLLWRKHGIEEGTIAKAFLGSPGRWYYVTVEVVEEDEAYISYDSRYGAATHWIRINKLWPTRMGWLDRFAMKVPHFVFQIDNRLGHPLPGCKHGQPPVYKWWESCFQFVRLRSGGRFFGSLRLWVYTPAGGRHIDFFLGFPNLK